MSQSDVLRTLDCWLWRLDSESGRIDTLGGSSPFGASAAGWRSALRMCTADSRRAVLDAARMLLASGAAEASQRVDSIELPAASGNCQRIDLLLGRDHAGHRGRAWIGLVARQLVKPAPSQPAAAPPPAGDGAGPGRVAIELDEAGLGWWSLESVDQGVLLSRTAANLLGFGDKSCRVPIGAWLSCAAPQDYPQLLQNVEWILDGRRDRFEIDLFGAADPAQAESRAGLRLTGLRARSPGNELIGVVQAIMAVPQIRNERAAGSRLHGAIESVDRAAAPDGGSETGIDRESLVREIHHRIKNHLQGMTGLIERYRNDYPGLGGALDAIGGQLHSIGTVYGLLARSGRSDLTLEEITQAVTDSLGGIAPGGITTRFCGQLSGWRIAEPHCVAIALVVNELVMNAIKHGLVAGGGRKVEVSCEPMSTGCLLSIRNQGTLPATFDFDSGTGARTGLQLVRTMLPARGATLTMTAASGQVDVVMRLEPPVLLVPGAV